MRLFHRTNDATRIRRSGFRDGEGTYLTDRVWRGVSLADSDPGPEYGRSLLTVDLPDSVCDYEWVEGGKPYREFMVPAEFVNRYGFVHAKSPRYPPREYFTLDCENCGRSFTDFCRPMIYVVQDYPDAADVVADQNYIDESLRLTCTYCGHDHTAPYAIP